MARTYQYAEAMAAGGATTSTSFGDQTSVTFTPGSSEKWVVLFSCGMTGSSVSAACQARLRHDTASVTYSNGKGRPNVASSIEWVPFSGVQALTFGASPGSQTFSIEYATDTAGSTSANCRDAALLAIKLTGNDDYNRPGTSPTSASTTWVDAATFTAPANGTYDIIGMADLTVSNTLSRAGFRFLLEDGSTAYRTVDVRWVNTGDIRNPVISVRRTLTTGQTVKIQFNRTNSTATVTCNNACIVGLDTANWTSQNIATDTTSRNTASAAYVQRNAASTLTWTPSSNQHFALWGNGIVDVSSQTAGNKGALHVLFNGTEQQDVNYAASNVTNDSRTILFLGKQQLSNASTTLTIEYGYLDSMTVTSQFGDVGYWELEPGSTAYTAAASGTEDSTASAAMSVGWHAAASGTEDSTASAAVLPNRGPLAELVDDFSGTLDQWDVGTSGATIVSGHLDLPYSSGVTNAIPSIDLWDAEGSRILAEVSDVDTASQSGMRIIDNGNATNYVDLAVVAGSLIARISTGGTVTSTTIRAYSSVTDAWWQIAKSGTSWLFSVSPNGIDATWTLVATIAEGWTAHDIRAEFWTIGA